MAMVVVIDDDDDEHDDGVMASFVAFATRRQTMLHHRTRPLNSMEHAMENVSDIHYSGFAVVSSVEASRGALLPEHEGGRHAAGSCVALRSGRRRRLSLVKKNVRSGFYRCQRAGRAERSGVYRCSGVQNEAVPTAAVCEAVSTAA